MRRTMILAVTSRAGRKLTRKKSTFLHVSWQFYIHRRAGKWLQPACRVSQIKRRVASRRAASL